MQTTSLAVATCVFFACATSVRADEVFSVSSKRTFVPGIAVRLGGYYDLDTDCNSNRIPVVSIVEQPAHGVVTVKNEPLYANFPTENSHYKCNFKQSFGVNVYYKHNASEDDADQPDHTFLRITFPSGQKREETFTIARVNRPASGIAGQQIDPDLPWEIPTRKANEFNSHTNINSKKERVLISSYTVNPDCSSPGFALFSLIDPPKHGKIRGYPELFYLVLPEGHPYFKCYGAQMKKTQIFYTPEMDFIGEDSVTVRWQMPSGREVNQTVSITQK